MEDSGYRSCDPSEFPMCSFPGSAHNIFSIKYSDLAASKYSGLLLGFQNEQDFEDFKQDLIDFQKLKKACCGEGVDGCDDNDSLLELEEELQFIRRPNNVCKERRKGHVIRRLNQLYQSPSLQPGLDIRSLQKPGVKTSLKKLCPENRNGLKDSLEETARPVSTEKRNSFDLRPDFDRRSDLFGFDRNSALRSSIHTILMEFLSGDEHFREFERVFETVNNRKDTANANLNLSCERNKRNSAHSNSEVANSSEVQQPSPGHVTDIFSDFFDNDETFLEFEKEFEKFRSSRRSNMLGSLNSVGSSRDIFGDMKAYCERNIKSKSGSRVSVNSFSTHDEATPICGDEAVHHELIWHSVEDWAKILRKMKRNSRLLLETCCPKHKPQYRHSISVQSRDGQLTDAYNKTQSLADLRRCSESGDLNQSHFYSSPYNNRARASQSNADLLQINSLPSVDNKQSTHQGCVLDKSFQSIDFSSDGEDSSEHWSENYDNDNRYSSSSTLCSGDGDIYSSFSCSCCSDLHVEEDTDDELLIDDRSPPHRARSHSLMEFSKHARPDHLGLHSVSMDNLLDCNHENKSLKWRINSSYSGMPLPKETHVASSVNCNAPYLDDDTPTDDDESMVGSIRWSRPPSTVSAQLSDAESEQYHSAASDLSDDQYSTAKSDLSHFSSGLGLESKSRSLTPDLPTAAPPVASATTDNDDHRQSVARAQYHSYHGREVRAKYKHDRPRSGSACQYTCHQQCLPAVTLNCKSISDDGCEVAISGTPSPSDPKSLETSLSVGRPFCGRPASGNSNSCTSTVTSQAAQRGSESVPDFHVVQRQSGAVDTGSSVVHSDLIYDYVGTPKATHLPSHHHLSRSASDSIFAGHSSHTPHLNKSSSPVPQISQGQHTSFPQSSSVHLNRLSGLNQQAHIQTYSPRQAQFQTAVLNTKVDEDVAVKDGVIMGNTNVTASDNTNNNLPQNPENSEDKLLDISNSDGSHEVTTERDETDSGYRSGTIPDDKLPRVPSQATLDRQALSRTIAKYNHFVPAAGLEMTEKESFQGFVKVTMNLIRPITMELGARPPSIYELLTREHIIEENTQQVAFYMPRDTHKSLHISSDTTTKEVVTSLLKKFHILDHPRKFAMYEQEFNDLNKLVRLRRLTDKDFPLRAILNWDPERITNYRMVLQENETGEIVWDAFSLPELGNFLKVLDREEKETILELKHKYAYMKQYMERRLTELRNERSKQTKC